MAMSRLPKKASFLLLLILFVGYSNGVPVDPAAVAASPAAAPAAPASPPVAAAPAPPPAAAVAEPATGANAVPPPQQPQVGGTITQHKNPDGSTVTVTRYNGPLPASAFNSQFGSGLSTGLHDYHNNLYQAQLLHRQQIQQATAAALLLQNMQIYNNFPLYRTTSTYLVPSYVYSPAPAPFFTPYLGYGFPFLNPYAGQARSA